LEQGHLAAITGGWPELRPALDRKVLDGARRLGQPACAEKLAELVPTTSWRSRRPPWSASRSTPTWTSSPDTPEALGPAR